MALVCWVLCALAAFAHRREAGRVDAALSLAAGSDSPGVVEAPPTRASPLDFVESLPRHISAVSIVGALQRHCAAEGVQLHSVTTSTRLGTERTLGRLELLITLRGIYPQIKDVLASTAREDGRVVLHRVQLRRMTSPTDVEAQVEVWLPTRPSEVGE